MTFGEKVRLLRTQNGLTQSQVAELSGLSLRTVINYEKYNKEPQKRETYDVLAKLFNVDVSYLMQDEINDYIVASKKKLNEKETDKPTFVLTIIKSLFQDEMMTDEDKKDFLLSVQELYWRDKFRKKRSGK